MVVVVDGAVGIPGGDAATVVAAAAVEAASAAVAEAAEEEASPKMRRIHNSVRLSGLIY